MSDADRHGGTTTRRSSSLVKPHLVIIAGTRAQTIPLPPAGELTLGRGAECDVQIDDRSLSRRHACLRIGPPVSVEDLRSANGTRVRGVDLVPGQPVTLGAGEVVELGSVMVVVHAGGKLLAHAQAGESVGAHVAPVIEDPAMKRLYTVVDRVAASQLDVLVLGETGVGKELIADALHRASRRAKAPLLRLSCAAFPEMLLESELFGHERGAFTGAVQPKPGLLESAAGGTVFLDEIGELPLGLQAKLLRVLEERRVRRLGAVRSRAIDVRFVSATNRDLEAEVARGAFRADLYFRVAGVTLAVPPLRERRVEIAPLARAFVVAAAAAVGLPVPALSPAAIAALEARDWPGNVRELRSAVSRAVLMCGSAAISPEHLADQRGGGAKPSSPTRAPAEPDGLQHAIDVVARQHIIDALARCGGNQTDAARLLGISRRTLSKRLDDLNVPRPRKRS